MLQGLALLGADVGRVDLLLLLKADEDPGDLVYDQLVDVDG